MSAGYADRWLDECWPELFYGDDEEDGMGWWTDERLDEARDDAMGEPLDEAEFRRKLIRGGMCGDDADWLMEEMFDDYVAENH